MRQIYIVNAIQVVTSETHPEGIYSTVNGYPKNFDSRNYNATEENPNGDEERALQVAKSEYFSRLSTMYASDTPTRVMSVVTLTRADGRQIMAERIGAFPDMTPIIEEETNNNDDIIEINDEPETNDVIETNDEPTNDESETNDEPTNDESETDDVIETEE